tara:strand:- start:353 stop:1063 length:711 start_codon:yes stop_codon:yes gene_type:complete
MREGLLQLLQLQEHDKRLEDLDKSKSQFPTEIEERKTEIASAGKVVAEMEEEKTDWEKKQRQSEGEIQLAKESLKVHEDRFSVVTNNKEYDALQIEIQACKDTVSEHETQLLQAMESIQRIENELEEENKAFEEVRRSQQESIDELQGQLDSMEELVQDEEINRAKAAETIDPKILAVYERRRGPRSRRIALTRKDSCGICFRQLPPQKLSEVRRCERVVDCENCGAIVVWNEDRD